jgi:hypothetical protein
MLRIGAAFVMAFPMPLAAEDAPDFFNRAVAPLLANHCLECHGEARKGGLDLRNRAGLAAGGEEGAVVEPGRPENSLLYQKVRDGEMPPKKPLTAAEVDILRSWIEMGAYLPEQALDPFAVSTDRRAGYDWWSLQPLRAKAPPDDHDLPLGWRSNPIDRFVYAKLREMGLTPSPPATSATLIRRATYDLHGLPPTPEECDAFYAACEAETGSRDVVGDRAFATLIDRLLASPRYGEQWGRHWLDVARFGESTGYEVNQIIDTLWPYRDYVIASFNNDKPFSRFVMEQLAGDMLAPGDPNVEIGLAFLVCGPYDMVGNQDPAQAAQIRANGVDEMVRAAGEAFLGLTVGCARCHDHKFDPITQRDYYSLYSIFSGVDYADRMVATKEQREAREAQLAPLRRDRDRLAEARTKIEQTILDRARANESTLEATWTRPKVNRRGTEELFAPARARMIRLRVQGRDDTPNAQTGFRIDEFEVFNMAGDNIAAAAAGAHAEGESRKPDDFADAYTPDLAIDGSYGARWMAAGNELRITFAREETINRIIFSSDRMGALKEDHPETPFVAEYVLEISSDATTWTEVASSRDRLPATPAHRRKRLMDSAITSEEREELHRLDRDIAVADQKIAAVPPLPSLRVGKLEQPRATQHVFLGGDPQRTGPEVLPASPVALQRALPGFKLAPDAPESDRRLALARWMVYKDNPLPPRVLANRLWQYHFGTGIVATPSDFGFMGEAPTHPELLDWLARELIAPGTYSVDDETELTPSQRIQQAWRLKRMHRLIMLSQTYRQSAAFRADAARTDADSRFLWRFPPRRLTGEELRDTMLMIAGKLDLRMGGPGFRLYRYIQDNVASYIPLDTHGPETCRRAIYHQNARAMHIDLVSDFDAPDCAMAAPRRVSTTSPLQALTLLNHEFTTAMAQGFAARLEQECGSNDLARQLQAAFLHALGRAPAAHELEAAESLVRAHGLRAFCRALFNMNELLYLGGA